MSNRIEVTTYSLSMVCLQDIKIFNSEGQRAMFRRLHKKKCDKCKNSPSATIIEPTTTETATTHNSNNDRSEAVKAHFKLTKYFG
jgi:hypothetical protein